MISDSSLDIIFISEFRETIERLEKRLFSDIKIRNRRFFDYGRSMENLGSISDKRKLIRKIESELRSSKYDELVLGNIGDELQYSLALGLRKRKAFKEVFSLDDGIPSISILRSFRRDSYYKDHHLKSPKHLLKNYLSFGKFLPFWKSLKPVSFFSNYTIDPGADNKLFLNEATWIKAFFGNKDVDPGHAIFIGSSLVERGIVEASDYSSYVQKAIDHFNAKNIRLSYFLHRLEDRKRIQSLTGEFKVVEGTLPIELEISASPKAPSSISSFFSSALLNFIDIVPEEIDLVSFRIPEKKLKGTKHEPKSQFLGTYKKLADSEKVKMIGLNGNE